MKHLKSFNESVKSSYILVNSTNYDECVEKIPKQLDEDGRVTLQVNNNPKDDGKPTYKKLLDRLRLEELSNKTYNDDKSCFYIEVTFI